MFWDDSSNYSQNVTCLYAVKHLCADDKLKSLSSEFLPRVLKECKHPTPNVRFSALQTLKELIPSLSSNVVATQVRPLVKELENDSDSDVQYFAKQCMQ
jgi:hypothetical protein